MKTENYYIPQNGGKRQSNQPYSYEYNKMLKESTNTKYIDFMENVKTYFLSEALNFILGKSLTERANQFSQYGTILCEIFVKEEGYENLSKRFKTSTYLLANIEKCVKEACDSVFNKADKENPLTFIIQTTDQDKFYDSLKGLCVDKVTKKINERVCNATEEFIQRNINTKLDIEELAAKTKERIDSAREKHNDELADKIQQEQMRIYKREVENIKKTPTRNIYEHMVNTISKCVLENEDIKDHYLSESGQFDLSKVEEQVQVMYTFLEMVNSLKIKKVTNKYIEECLTSIS